MTAVRFVQARKVVSRRTTGAVLLRPVSADSGLVSVVGTGIDLWDALVEPRTIADVAEDLATRYDTSSGRVVEDLVPVLADLVERGVVEELTD